ncbi:hypothetical protein Tco_1437700 [Tanacetum coccineum]
MLSIVKGFRDGEFCQRCTCVRCGSGLSKGLCLICASRYGNNPNPISLNDSPNISENVSQSPPLIDYHCCYECEEPMDGFFCQQCTCKSCGNGAHYGYNCPPKVSIISNPEPCNNQNVDEFPQTLPSFHPTCYSGDGSSFTYDSTPNFIDDSLTISTPSQPEDRNKIYDPGICIEVESTRFLATHSPVIDTLLPFSSENKNKVFNHGVLASKEKHSFLLHYRGFKASKLFHHKSPMLIYGEDIPILDVPFLHFYPP